MDDTSGDARSAGALAPAAAPTSTTRRGSELLGLMLALAAVAFGWWARVHTAFADPNFDVARPEGMLKSDPGLLYYFTERILDAGGGVPSDFRADPRVLHPGTIDIPARFPVGQEFVVAWWHQLFGGGEALHVSCVRAMGLWASLSALCLFGLVRELTRRPLVAGLAAVLFALLPVDYRTIGFVLVREDFSLPWLALHLFLAARAVGRSTSAAAVAPAVGSAAALACAVATWHAMPFLVALEALAVAVWVLRCDQNPFASRAGLAAAGVLLAAALGVPILRATRFALSEPMLVVWALCAAGLARRKLGRVRALLVGLATLLAFCVAYAAAWASGGGRGEYSHVLRLALAKLEHLGRLPDDPTVLPFEVRLMWQGPFATLDFLAWSELALWTVGALTLALAAWTVSLLRRPRGDPRIAVLALFALASLPLAWLVGRTVILPGLLAAPLAALAVVGLAPRRAGLFLSAVCALQALPFSGFLREHRIGWYLPPVRQAEIARMLEALPSLVPEGDAVVADFVNSTAVLAHTRRPIVLQPKYEDRESRRRAERFFEAFFHGPPDGLARLLREEFGARTLLVDRFTLGYQSRFLAGLTASAPLPPGSAAEAFLSQAPDILEGVPGFELLYRSPTDLVQSNGLPSDFFRLYRVSDP